MHIHFAGDDRAPHFERAGHVNARFSALSEAEWSHLKLKLGTVRMGQRIANGETNLTDGSKSTKPKGSVCSEWQRAHDEVEATLIGFGPDPKILADPITLKELTEAHLGTDLPTAPPEGGCVERLRERCRLRNLST